MSDTESHSNHHHSDEHHSHHHNGEHHHHHRHHSHSSEKLSKDEKRHCIKKLRSFIRSVEHFKSAAHSSEEFKMEVRRYFYDNFHGFERHWLRHHCPIMKRLKLFFLGVSIKNLH